MKQKILFIALCVSVVFNIYLVKYEVVVTNDFDQQEQTLDKQVKDQVTIAQSSVKKNSHDCAPAAMATMSEETGNLAKVKIDETSGPKEKLDLSSEQIQEKLEAKYRQWIEKSDQFFIDDLRLSPDQIARYRDLTLQREKDISDYFTQKHKSQEEGSLESYLYTSEDTIFMGKLAERYENLLKENFGQENYQRHREFIKKHNGKMKNDDFMQIIEF
jgi:hypothetical protein